MAIEEYSPDEVFYNYSGLLSKNRMINFVVGGRGTGKSYNFKRLLIKQFLDKNKQFMIIRRKEVELEMMKKTYFNDILQEFEDLEIEVKGNVIFMNDKEAGYFQALSTATNLRSSSFPNVYTIFFEEFIIENINTTNKYLKQEVFTFFGLCETVFRHREGCRVIFAANNGGITNPYFDYFKIKVNSDKRYQVGELYVLENYNNPYFVEMKKNSNAFSKIYSGTEYENYALHNQTLFDKGDKFVKQKTKTAYYWFGISYNGNDYSFWSDVTGEIYMRAKADKNHPYYFAVTDEDHYEQTLNLKNFRNHPRVKRITTAYSYSLLFFETAIIREQFEEMKKFFNL